MTTVSQFGVKLNGSVVFHLIISYIKHAMTKGDVDTYMPYGVRL